MNKAHQERTTVHRLPFVPSVEITESAAESSKIAGELSNVTPVTKFV